MMTELACVFPSAEEALMVARYLSGNPDVETLPSDGELTDPETGQVYRYNIAAFGTLYYDTGQKDENGAPIHAPIMWHEPGPPAQEWEAFCLIGLWHGPPETVPFPLHAFMQNPEGFPVRYG